MGKLEPFIRRKRGGTWEGDVIMVASARGRGSSGTGEDWIWLTLVLCGVGWQCWNAEHLQVHCRQEEAGWENYLHPVSSESLVGEMRFIATSQIQGQLPK